VIVEHTHTGVSLIERDGVSLFDARAEGAKGGSEKISADRREYSLLNVKDILEFAQTTELDEIGYLIRRQVELNSAIAEEGLVGEDVEATIRNIGQVGSVGMRATDLEIIKVMLKD
jgi:L-cysteine desulfidase